MFRRSIWHTPHGQRIPLYNGCNRCYGQCCDKCCGQCCYQCCDQCCDQTWYCTRWVAGTRGADLGGRLMLCLLALVLSGQLVGWWMVDVMIHERHQVLSQPACNEMVYHNIYTASWAYLYLYPKIVFLIFYFVYICFHWIDVCIYIVYTYLHILSSVEINK